MSVSEYFLFVLVVLFPFFFSAVGLKALDPGKSITQYKLDIWQAERGLEQNSVFVVLRSRNGFLWLATLNGLVRFDGIRFKTFNRTNTEGLESNNIRALYQDDSGILWIGTEDGGLTRLVNGDFKTWSNTVHPYLTGISALFRDNEGDLWIGTITNGLIRFSNGKFTVYTTADGLPSKHITCFGQDRAGNLLIGTAAGLVIGEAPGVFKPALRQNELMGKHIRTVIRTGTGELWIGINNGLFSLKDNILTDWGSRIAIPDYSLISLCSDSHGNLWVGTDGTGLVRISNNNVRVLTPAEGLPSGHIYSVYEDSEQNLWIGTLKGGLCRLRDTVFSHITTKEGLSHNSVKFIGKERNGKLRIGTISGLNILENGKLSLEWNKKKGLLSDEIRATLQDKNGVLWIGTKRWLTRFKNGIPKHFDSPSPQSNIQQILEDKDGAVLVLRLYTLERFLNERSTVILDHKQTKSKIFFCFYIGRDGYIWIGTYGGGVYRIQSNNQNNSITAYSTNEGLVHNQIQCFYQDNNGVLYIGTRGGLSIFRNGKFTNITTGNGLLDSFVHSIIEDRLGNFWLAGRIGISRIGKKQLNDFAAGELSNVTPTLFNESNGLLSTWTYKATRTADGRLWFATDKGVAVIDPADIRKNPLPPPVVIEDIAVDGETIHIGSLAQRYTKDKPLVLPPGKERITFQYSGLSFIRSNQVAFKLKLDGYDPDWIDAGFARSTDYTRLSPGAYTFTVIARNSDGVWNKKGASFSFYLKPYFYQTVWFYAGLVLFALLSAFFFYRFRVRHLKKREAELSLLVDEQTDQLKELDKIKSRFFANLSHEFRTPLTLIMGPLQQMIDRCGDDQQQQKKKYILMLRNAQRLLRLINQLLELSKLDSGKMRLQAVSTDIIAFVKGLVSSFQLFTEQRELELVFEGAPRSDKSHIWIDRRKMEDVLSNLLVNAIKFTPSGGKVTVSFFLHPPQTAPFTEGAAGISIRDTGHGIPSQQLSRIFDRFYQVGEAHELYRKGSGIGLALTKELVELHHGTIQAESSEGRGSTFTLSLPIGNSHLEPDEMLAQDSTAENPDSPAEMADISMMDMIFEEEEFTPDKPANGQRFMDESPSVNTDIILVVEDSADMRTYIRDALEPEFNVFGAVNGREGIETAKDIIPDLIISDIMMPEVNGYELCHTLKNHIDTSHIPIILLTAKASENSIVHGLETDADDYMTKPFSTRILHARIKNLIRLRRQFQDKFSREMTVEPESKNVSPIDKEFITDLKAVIETNLADPDFDVDQLKDKLYMGRTTLYRKIKALSGETPADFIRSYRLKRGAELLLKGNLSVIDIAFEVGFSSAAYFRKWFKAKYQLTPTQYQEKK